MSLPYVIIEASGRLEVISCPFSTKFLVAADLRFNIFSDIDWYNLSVAGTLVTHLFLERHFPFFFLYLRICGLQLPCQREMSCQSPLDRLPFPKAL